MSQYDKIGAMGEVFLIRFNRCLNIREVASKKILPIVGGNRIGYKVVN